jgi:glycosyltransferase involved in cell wall biosynthesis
VSDVVLFDPRGSFASLDQDLIDRHKEYVLAAREFPLTSISRLVVLTGKTKQVGILYRDDALIIIGCNRHMWLQVFMNYRKTAALREIDFLPQIITCSDPWASYFYARISSVFRVKSNGKRRIPVQLQVHADFLAPKWSGTGLIPLAKSVLSRFAIKRADQIRCVSKSIAVDIVNRFNIPTSKVISIPVPLNVGAMKFPAGKELPLSIGFVGRIHFERGLKVFSEIASELIKIEPNLRVIIAGDGPERESFLMQLQTNIPVSNIEFLGQLNLNQMEAAWNKIGILLSTAPTESYGRATREALMHGIPVWGVPSRGISELIEEAGSVLVRELSVQLSTNNLEVTLRELLALQRDDGYYTEYLQRRKEIVNDIGSAWARLSKTCQ